MSPHQQIQEKLLALQAAILSSHPTLPTLMREIHQNLKADPAVVTLMTEEEIQIVVSGLKEITSTQIATSLAKPASAAAKKALKNVSSNDLGF